MREISAYIITETIKEMCIEANCYVSKDILESVKKY